MHAARRSPAVCLHRDGVDFLSGGNVYQEAVWLAEVATPGVTLIGPETWSKPRDNSIGAADPMQAGFRSTPKGLSLGCSIVVT